MPSNALPQTFHARPSSIGTWIGVLVAVSGAFVGLGVFLDSARLMIRAGGGIVVGLLFLGIWLVNRVKSVTIEPGAVLLDARRFSTTGARVTKLETRVVQVNVRRSFWMALPDGKGGEVKRGFSSVIWPEIEQLYAALRAAGVEDGMPYPE